MEYTQAEKVLQNAGYTVHSISSAQADIGHHKFLVSLSGKDLDEKTFTASFQSDLGIKWGTKTVDPLFGGEISLEREAAIYSLARDTGLPAPVVRLENGETPFLLEEVLQGKNMKEYVTALPKKQQRKAYLDAVRKVGALFARAHEVSFADYGDVVENNLCVMGGHSLAIANMVDTFEGGYAKRLHNIVTHNLAWNGHERSFTAEELGKVRDYLKKTLQDLEQVEEFPEPTFVLANLHRGNVLLNDAGEISGISQFNFAQAGVPAAEMYNAFWQFADAAVAPTAKVHAALVEAYQKSGGQFDPAEEATQKVMNVLNVNHFLRAATVYSSMRDRQDQSKPDLMRNRWGKRFKEEILFPLIEQGKVDYDLFSQIINEKWKP